MTISEPSKGLTKDDLGHLKYLTRLALQPTDSWQGFYRTPSEGMNFGLRFQIAFAGYALYGLARRTPAYRAAYSQPLAALIERMISAPTWAYWFQGATRNPLKETEPPKASGRAIEVVHSRLGMGAIPADPCQQGNIQYSAHLASLLGFYELLTADRHYDEAGFSLKATANGQDFEFHYTHTSLAQHIHAQMEENRFGGVCCEPGRAYAACNNHACISNVLHDRLHGTRLAEANSRWAEWVKKRMLTGGVKGGLPLPAPNGLLSVAYMPDLHLSIPVSFNLTDAWGLAFMAAWEPTLVKQVYPRLRKKLKAGPAGTLYLGSVSPNEKVEISSTGLNTGFAAILAREMGDEDTFQRLKAWAEANLNPQEDHEGRYYAGGRPVSYVTALFTLAGSLPPTGGGLQSLLAWRPDFEAPYLAHVTPGTEVSQAEWKKEGRLELELIGQSIEPVTLRIENCLPVSQITLNGAPIEAHGYNAQAQRVDLNLKLASGKNQIMLQYAHENEL